MNEIEEKYVYDTYNKIAIHFSNTRSYIWPNIKNYIDKIESNSIIADIGCGNGKNMYRDDCFNLGVDFCEKFVEICQDKQKNVIIGNCLEIPLKSESVDYTLNIAVLHHLSTLDRRLNVINELIRITKPNGKILIQVWAYESKRGKKQNSQNAMIKWNLQKKYNNQKQNVEIDRYYYLFKENELPDMIPIDKVKIVDYYNSHDNWVIELEKNTF